MRNSSINKIVQTYTKVDSRTNIYIKEDSLVFNDADFVVLVDIGT